jgi:threonine dehydratase
VGGPAGDTHQVVEGAGAAPLAALQKDGDRAGRKVALIVTGGNIDRDLYLRVLSSSPALSVAKPG